ncbi:hypothetical protein [Oceanibium sediminis]|uniref:hypothetical protein n=1 Tax=Oceanibium sediminis TaxID=2026339 RepID=UPI001300AB7B|nr:hypothetical protein [Oceanibium sediminis]
MTRFIDRRTAIKTAAGSVLAGGTVLAGSPALANQPHMEKALGYLHHAYEELEAADHDKGGHRVEAMKTIKSAMLQVRQGIKAGA